MSVAVLLFVGEALFYYSTNINDIFIAKDFIGRFRSYIFFLNSAAVLYISGDICKVVEESIGQWAAYFTETTPEEGIVKVDITNITRQCHKTLMILLSEAESHIISISGNIFVLDYNAIFNVRTLHVKRFKRI